MKASEFLALCESNWEKASYLVWGIIEPDHPLRADDSYHASYHDSYHWQMPYYIDYHATTAQGEKRLFKADARYEREARKALYRLADEQNLTVEIIRFRPQQRVLSIFQLSCYNEDVDKSFGSDNESWLYAAALVELSEKGAEK